MPLCDGNEPPRAEFCNGLRWRICRRRQHRQVFRLWGLMLNIGDQWKRRDRRLRLSIDGNAVVGLATAAAVGAVGAAVAARSAEVDVVRRAVHRAIGIASWYTNCSRSPFCVAGSMPAVLREVSAQ